MLALDKARLFFSRHPERVVDQPIQELADIIFRLDRLGGACLTQIRQPYLTLDGMKDPEAFRERAQLIRQVLEDLPKVASIAHSATARIRGGESCDGLRRHLGELQQALVGLRFETLGGSEHKRFRAGVEQLNELAAALGLPRLAVDTRVTGKLTFDRDYFVREPEDEAIAPDPLETGIATVSLRRVA